MLDTTPAQDRIDEIIERAVNASHDPHMRVALEECSRFFADNWRLRFTFSLNASGSVKDHDMHNASAQSLIDFMDTENKGLTKEFIDEALPAIQDLAVQHNRRISRFKRHGVARIAISITAKHA